MDPPPGCRFAGRCFAKVEGRDAVVPPLVEVKPNHQCACHRYDEGGPVRCSVRLTAQRRRAKASTR